MPPAHRPRLVIFDCDGVLVDSERLEVDTIAEAVATLGTDIDPAMLHERHRGGKLIDLIGLIETELGQATPPGFIDRYRELQLRRLVDVTAVPGAVEVVESLVHLGVPRCIVSGGPHDKMKITLGATGLWDAFAPNIYSCYDVGEHKPGPAVYLHALDQFEAAATEAIAIEDSANGVRAAVAAQVPVIGLARDVSPAELVDAGASTTIDHMSQAPRMIAQLASARL